MKPKNLIKLLLAIFFVFAKDCVEANTKKIVNKIFNRFLDFMSPP